LEVLITGQNTADGSQTFFESSVMFLKLVITM